MLMKVFDFGGQVAFRCIQHLYILRNSTYVIVFDLGKVLCEASRGHALEHIQYWIHIILTHGKLSEKEKEVLKREKEQNGDKNIDDTFLDYPPMVLVGTHFDDIKQSCNNKREEVNKKLKEVNNILIKNFLMLPLYR